METSMAEEGATGGSITVRDVPAAKFISAYAEVLKNNDRFVVPKWADLVKTGVHKELAPYDPDWYYIRAGKRIFFSHFQIFLVLAHVYGLALITRQLFSSYVRTEYEKPLQ
jgi:Ribosomal protein S19e